MSETVVKQLEKSAEVIKTMDAAMVVANKAIEDKTAELAGLTAKLAEATKAAEGFDAKIKALDAEVVAFKELVAKKDESIASLEAKIKMIPAAAEAVDGTKAVADGSTDVSTVDHVAEYRKITDTKAAGEYYKAHEKEIRAQLK